MDEDEKEAVEVRPSVTMDQVMEEARRRPLEVFDSYPIQEIREVCIKALEDGGWNLPWNLPKSEILANWAENRIEVLISWKDPMWKKILNWYVFNAGSGAGGYFISVKVAVRAVEFAIATASFGGSLAGEAGHCVSARLQRNPELYWQVPRMKEFLEMSLFPRSDEIGRVSWRFGWTSAAERAIRRITDARDTTFLPLIRQLAIEDRWLAPVPADPFALPAQSAVLCKAAEMLAEAVKDQTPDLNSTVGARLREDGGLRGSVAVSVDYPERVEVGARLVLIRVLFTTTRADEKEQLSQILPRLKVFWEGEGFDPAGRIRGEITIDTASGVGGVEMTVTTRGRKRFWVVFSTKIPAGGGGVKPICTMAGYVTVE